MSDEERNYQQAIKTALEKFKLAGRLQRERKPVVDVLPNVSNDFNPDLCVRCHGAGWMVRRDEEHYGELVRCECDRAKMQSVGRCWSVSSMQANNPNAPRLNAFEPYTPEAEAVLAAMGTFVRQPFGWFTLYGGAGTGKSHALEAMIRYFLTTKVPAVYINSIYLWEYLGGVERGQHDSTDYAERFRWMCGVPALAIDELNVEKSTDFVFKTRRGLLDARYRAALGGQGVTIIASNDAPSGWSDAAVADRALDSRFVCVFSGTKSYRQVKRGQQAHREAPNASE